MAFWHHFSWLVADHGPFYGPVSGWVSDLGIFGAPLVLYRKHNCHVRGCWRIGHHPAGHHIVCRRHHPDVPDKAPRAHEL